MMPPKTQYFLTDSKVKEIDNVLVKKSEEWDGVQQEKMHEDTEN